MGGGRWGGSRQQPQHGKEFASGSVPHIRPGKEEKRWRIKTHVLFISVVRTVRSINNFTTHQSLVFFSNVIFSGDFFEQMMCGGGGLREIHYCRPETAMNVCYTKL